jgi:hypothetical protein
MSRAAKPIRRVVTCNDEQGLSGVLFDSAAPNVKISLFQPGTNMTDVWVFHSCPALITGTRDDGNLPFHFEPPHEGGHLRVVQSTAKPADYDPDTDKSITPAHAPHPVESPKGDLEYIHYFCGNTEIPSDLEEREPQRAMLYKAVAGLARAYANIADEMDEAGYSSADIKRIKDRLEHYLAIREIIRNAAGETLDLKAYEADMRHLIDTYIEADEARKISPFDNVSLLDLIVNTGIADAITSRLGGLKGNKDAVAETIDQPCQAFGSETAARRPPSGRLVSVSWPPCPWIIESEIARPRPIPPVSRLRDPSTR